jgi:glutamine amidotransferase
VNYGNGNANSIKNALASLGASSVYSSDPIEIDSADCIILPGVGHFGAAMQSLRERGLHQALRDAALRDRKPVLGICLGMQLMTEFSEEGMAEGLAWVRGRAQRIRPPDSRRFKVPHVGWNTVSPKGESVLLRGLDVADEPFYFCHSYAFTQLPSVNVTSTVTYGQEFLAHFEVGNIFGVQFHPEKSHDTGLALIRNFLQLAS